jgi:hypothetical protein
VADELLDEATSDDGALHLLFQTLSPERVAFTLAALRRLSRVRGPVTLEERLLAVDLATNPDWPLGTHPVVQRVLLGEA